MKVNVLRVICVVAVVKSKRVAYLDLLTAHVDHAAVSVEHVDDRCAFYVAVLATS